MRYQIPEVNSERHRTWLATSSRWPSTSVWPSFALDSPTSPSRCCSRRAHRRSFTQEAASDSYRLRVASGTYRAGVGSGRREDTPAGRLSITGIKQRGRIATLHEKTFDSHLRDDQEVDRRLRVDVAEGECLVVLKHDVGRDLLGDDLVEDCGRALIRLLVFPAASLLHAVHLPPPSRQLHMHVGHACTAALSGVTLSAGGTRAPGLDSSPGGCGLV